MSTYLVAGYVYRGSVYCDGDCLTEVLLAERRLAPAALDSRIAENLAMLAEVEALDYVEARDSDTVPQPVTLASGDLMGESCEGCGAMIDEPYVEDCPLCGDPIDYCLGHGSAIDLDDWDYVGLRPAPRRAVESLPRRPWVDMV